MSKYKHLITPILSLVILTLGSSLLTTFLALRLHSLGVNQFLIGSLTAAYYAGMLIGAFKLESLILRVGHIRAYAAFASLLSVIAILHGLYVNVYIWLLLRFISGIATAGLYIVIESWILSTTTNNNRGSSLALYMLALYVAQAAGQWLLVIGNHQTLVLYCISAVFASLSVIPLSLTKSVIPLFGEPDTLSIKKMFSISPSGMATCFASGLLLGSVYGLYPIFIQSSGYSVSKISTIMGLTIFGGMLFQYPLGKLSDIVSRRLIIALLCAFSIIFSVLLLLMGKANIYMISTLSFCLGGSVFCLYPIGISHSCDRIENNQIMSATQTLLFAYGLGATIGPVLSPAFNLFQKGSGILIFIIVISALLGVMMVWRKSLVASVPAEDKEEFTLSMEMTPVGTEIDPRAHSDEGSFS